MSSEKSGPSADYRPLHNICEFLHAVHIYADEARTGKARYVEASHYCSHVSKDLRQCLIYDSATENARLIGVEYMIPKEVYETLDKEEQKLWHSHEFEVASGMLILPTPTNTSKDQWENAELEAMKEISGLYGKTWHFWQVDRGDALPLGHPVLMGSLVKDGQLDLDEVLKDRNARFGVDHHDKADRRAKGGVKGPGIHPNADYWWKEGGVM